MWPAAFPPGSADLIRHYDNADIQQQDAWDLELARRLRPSTDPQTTFERYCKRAGTPKFASLYPEEVVLAAALQRWGPDRVKRMLRIRFDHEIPTFDEFCADDPEWVARHGLAFAAESYEESYDRPALLMADVRRDFATMRRTVATLLVREYGPKCSACGVVAKPPCVDHIVPVSKGGENRWSNFQVLCWSCNSRKGNRT